VVNIPFFWNIFRRVNKVNIVNIIANIIINPVSD